MSPEATLEPPPGPSAPPPRRGRRIVWIAVFVVVIAAIVFVVHSRLAGQSRRPNFAFGGPLPVGIAQVSTADVPVVINALGTVTPLATVNVRPQVTGPLIKIAFTEGQMIHAGGLLAEIDPRPYQAALDQALGKLQSDQALLANDRVDLDRYKMLLSQNSVSEQQYATQVATVARDEAQVTTDKASVEAARLNLGYCTITSPVTGRVGLRQVDLGNLLQANQATPIVSVTQMQPMSVLFTVPETQLSEVFQRLNDGKQLTVEAYGRNMQNLITTGKLASADNQINTTTGTLQMRAMFSNAKDELFPNEFVNVKLVLNTLMHQTIVPGAAVQNGPSSNFVFIVNPNSTVSQRTVVTGPTYGNDIAILKGLKVGETVVVDGADQLRDGARVRLPGARPANFALGARPGPGGQAGRFRRGGPRGAPPDTRRFGGEHRGGRGGAGPGAPGRGRAPAGNAPPRGA